MDANGNGTFDTGEDFVNADSFQVISAGLDEAFGVTTGAAVSIKRLYPTGTNYEPGGADDDNVANFCTKARLGDAKP